MLARVRRPPVLVLLCAATLAACGATPSGVQTFAAYHGPPLPAPVPVSTAPALRAADVLCRTVVPALRPTIRSAYMLDGESLSAADLTARGAVYTAASLRLRALALRLQAERAVSTVHALGVGLHALAAALKVLGHATAQLPALGGNANLPGAQAAIAADAAGIAPYALMHRLPDCSPL